VDEWFKDLKRVHKAVRKHRPSEFDKVKVAIIDTGVNFEHPIIDRAVKVTKAIREENCQGFPNNARYNPKVDKHGHGTFVTSVLLETAPDVSLYIARVFNDHAEALPDDDHEQIAEVRTYTVKGYLKSVGYQLGHQKECRCHLYLVGTPRRKRKS
jgi:hypothetical protein